LINIIVTKGKNMNDKQAQKNALKDKIKMLMNKNKQIDDIVDVSPSQQKQHLQKQKDDNNDELRKIRSQKYELEQIQENIDYIKRTYLYLKKLGIVKSQYDFSSNFLNRTNHYLSMIICEERKPSIESVNVLVKNLIEIKNVFEDLDNKNAEIRILNDIINRGHQIITERLLGYL